MAFVLDDLMNGVGSYYAQQQQQDMIRAAMAQQQGVYNQSRQDMSPYMQGGQQTLQGLLQQMQSGGFNTSVDPRSVANDPGYQFRMQQGQQALQRSAAARGGLNSGAFMKGLDQYSQGLASQEYGNAFARQQSENQANFSRQFGVAGMGYNAAANLGQLGQGYANNMSNLYGAMGNSLSAQIMGPTNAGASAVRSGANIGMMAAGMPGGAGGFTSMLGGLGGGGGGGGYGGGVGYGAGGIPTQGFNGYGGG